MAQKALQEHVGGLLIVGTRVKSKSFEFKQTRSRIRRLVTYSALTHRSTALRKFKDFARQFPPFIAAYAPDSSGPGIVPRACGRDGGRSGEETANLASGRCLSAEQSASIARQSASLVRNVAREKIDPLQNKLHDALAVAYCKLANPTPA